MRERYASLNRTKGLQHFLEDLGRKATSFEGWFPLGERRILGRYGLERLFPKEKVMALSTSQQIRSALANNDVRGDMFFRHPENQWAFKSGLWARKENVILLNMPEEVLFLEKRADPRYDLVGRERVEMLFTMQEHMWKRNFLLSLKDISKGGASINIPYQLLPFFTEGTQIRVYELGGENLGSNGVSAVIKSCYHRSKPETKTLHHFGIQFNKPLASGVLDPIIERNFATKMAA